MRVLFVDDETQVLAGLERTLFMAERGWELAFAGSGADALRAQPADVVVSDMRMPLLDGAGLLRQMRERCPRSVRILLSGQTDQDAALRALDVAQQFLLKPCDGDALIGVLDRVVALRRLLDDAALQAAVGRIGGLPAAPRLRARFERLLDDPHADTAQVAAVVQADPALAAKVLQLANFGVFGDGQPVAGIREAVQRLGLGLLRTLAAASDAFRGDAAGAAEANGVVALRASRLAAMIGAGHADADVVATAALLADVGALLPGAAQLCREADPQGGGVPSPAQVGAYLLGIWGLPTAVVEAVAQHRHPARAAQRRFEAAGVVHVAVALARGQAPDAAYLQAMGVAAQLPRWQADCARMRHAEGVP